MTSVLDDENKKLKDYFNKVKPSGGVVKLKQRFYNKYIYGVKGPSDIVPLTGLVPAPTALMHATCTKPFDESK